MTAFETSTDDVEDRFERLTESRPENSTGLALRRPRPRPVREFVRARPKLWMEAVVVVWLLWLYDAVDNLSHVRAADAIGHAAGLLDLERRLHMSVELGLNHFTSGHHLFALVVADYYDNAHFVVTFGVLGWLWIARPDHYRDLRRALVLINLIGFAVFLGYPMAPPRMLPGFVDTVAATHAIGSWHSGGLASDANQYAAMPSLHLAWAVWSCIAVCSTTRWKPVRAAAIVYPLLTFFAVVATANHLVIDSLAGVATAFVAVGSPIRGSTRAQ